MHGQEMHATERGDLHEASGYMEIASAMTPTPDPAEVIRQLRETAAECRDLWEFHQGIGEPPTVRQGSDEVHALGIAAGLLTQAASILEGVSRLRRACMCAEPDPVMQADAKFYCHRCSFETGARPTLAAADAHAQEQENQHNGRVAELLSELENSESLIHAAEALVRTLQDENKVMREDLYAIGAALGIGAKPYSGHEAVERDFLPLVRTLQAERDALRDELERTKTKT